MGRGPSACQPRALSLENGRILLIVAGLHAVLTRLKMWTSIWVSQTPNTTSQSYTKKMENGFRRKMRALL